MNESFYQIKVSFQNNLCTNELCDMFILSSSAQTNSLKKQDWSENSAVYFLRISYQAHGHKNKHAPEMMGHRQIKHTLSSRVAKLVCLLIPQANQQRCIIKDKRNGLSFFYYCSILESQSFSSFTGLYL
jgi:hypothetical protein